MSSIRQEKVTALLKRELSPLVNNAVPYDAGLVTVTDIFVTPDLKEARVVISVFNTDKEKQVLKAINTEIPSMQGYLGRKLKMKFTPRLYFKADNYQNEVNKVDELLENIDHGA